MTQVHAHLGTAYKTSLQSGRHTIIADEPLEADGADMGMAPTQLLLSGLAACKVMTMRWLAERNKWELTSADATLTLDSERSKEGTKTTVRVKISLEGNLSETQRQKLLEVADKCPVHRMLHGTFDIQSSF